MLQLQGHGVVEGEVGVRRHHHHAAPRAVVADGRLGQRHVPVPR
jgi:hypothetical protein